MLNKREEPNSNAGLEGKSFVSKHAPRLLDPAAQDIIYKDQGKERELINLWSTILEAYFREVLLMSVNHFYKVLLFLELNGVQTSSLKRILREEKLPNFAMAADAQDFKLMKSALRGQNRGKLVDRIVSWFQQRQVDEDSCLLIHIPSFKAAHAKFSKTVTEVLGRKELVKERELFQHVSSSNLNSEFEQRIFLDLMCFDRQLSRNKLFRDIIYSSYYADDRSLPLQKGLLRYSLREVIFKAKNRLEAAGDNLAKSRAEPAQEPEPSLPLRSRRERLLDFMEVLNDIQRILEGIESSEEFDSVFAVFRYVQNKISAIDGWETYTNTSINNLERFSGQENPSIAAL